MVGLEQEKGLKDGETGLSENEDQYARRPSSSAKNIIIVGFFIVFCIFGGVGLWSATAPLARAIYASAVLVVKGEPKKIQHCEGGERSAIN
jgi:hypothetical protein